MSFRRTLLACVFLANGSITAEATGPINLRSLTLAARQVTRETRPSETPARPNILFLLADDLRFDALGCMGDKIIQTPNIDALAKRGVLFRNAFVTTSICCVSRASILTGQYARRHGINDFKTNLSAEAFAQTYVALLKRAGYRIGFIGKYGVGDTMPVREFDFWRGFPGQGSYYGKMEKTHLTRRMGDDALDFLKSPAGKTPWCLSVSFKSPHAQDRAKREYPPDPRDEELYRAAAFPVAKTATEAFFDKLPPEVRKSEGRTRWTWRFDTPEKHQQIVRDYYRLITGMDREIGRIIAELERLGLLETTLIVFASDNGYFLAERGLADKWFMYEESIRVPLIVVDPRLPKSRHGTTVANMALNIDLAPMFLDYAGVAPPKTMQGVSLRPLVEAKKTKWRDEWFYEHLTLPKIIPPSEGVRTDRWAYIRWIDTSPVREELYDVERDPREEQDLAAAPEHRATLERLRERWRTLRDELK